MSDILRAIIIKTTQDVLIDDECKSFIYEYKKAPV